MPDHATSSDLRVQRQLDRLTALGPGTDILGLHRITRLLDRVGNPHLALPPVFHVAGTNGKGSTCAFLRAAIEASGKRVHVYSSPHLVRFNERIRLAGTLISDDMLGGLLEEVLDSGGDIGASFFEVTTAAAFLAFHRTPADACVIEVGLGGRLDATNVLAAPAVCGIAQLGIDHEAFLGSDAVGIAKEKAGIAKAGSPLVISFYRPELTQAVRDVATMAGAPVFAAGEDWRFSAVGDYLAYSDRIGDIAVPLPVLAGAHQHANLALALAMLRHQDQLSLSPAAFCRAPGDARWPARMQRLSPGPLTALLPPEAQLWLDGGHNAAAGKAVAEAFGAALADAGRPKGRLVIGMLENKDPHGLLVPLAPLIESMIAVPVPGHPHHPPTALAHIGASLGIASVATAPDIAGALTGIAGQVSAGEAPAILILGSLYLAGEILAANGEPPE